MLVLVQECTNLVLVKVYGTVLENVWNGLYGSFMALVVELVSVYVLG